MTALYFRVRNVQSSDVPALADLLNRIVDEGDKTAIDIKFDEQEFRQWFISEPHSLTCVVAEAADSQLLGFQITSLYDADELLPGWADIGTFVDDGLRGSGVGKALFQQTVEELNPTKFSHLRAVIRNVNTGAIAYYSRCGFVPASEVDSRMENSIGDKTVLGVVL